MFSDIEDAVLSGTVDAGLLIHENRFTYQERGLKKIMDMGEWWEQKYHLPIPLGGIMVKRSLPESLKKDINRTLHNSVLHAMQNPEAPMAFIREHAQTMKDEVMKQHIALYVNDFSLSLGETGRKAIELLFDTAPQNMKNKLVQPIFAV